MSFFKLLNTEKRGKATELQHDFCLLDYRKLAFVLLFVFVFSFFFCVFDELYFVIVVLQCNIICLLSKIWLALRRSCNNLPNSFLYILFHFYRKFCMFRYAFRLIYC